MDLEGSLRPKVDLQKGRHPSTVEPLGYVPAVGDPFHRVFFYTKPQPTSHPLSQSGSFTLLPCVPLLLLVALSVGGRFNWFPYPFAVGGCTALL